MGGNNQLHLQLTKLYSFQVKGCNQSSTTKKCLPQGYIPENDAYPCMKSPHTCGVKRIQVLFNLPCFRNHPIFRNLCTFFVIKMTDFIVVILLVTKYPVLTVKLLLPFNKNLHNCFL